MDRLIYPVVKALRRFKRAAYWLISAPHAKNWRTELMKSTFFRFPAPTPEGRDKRAKVSKLGKMFYEHKFPSWVIWNKDEPNTLYINVDMLGAILAKQLKLYGVDDLVKSTAFSLGQALLQDKVNTTVDIKMWGRDLVKWDVIPEVWLSQESLNVIRNF